MIESIEEFLKRIERTDLPEQYEPGKEFFALVNSSCKVSKTFFSFRDFFKISLVTDCGKLFYADKWIMIDRPALMFSSPLIPYAWEAISAGKTQGCFCIFNDLFISSNQMESIFADSPLLDISQERVFFLNDDSLANVNYIFDKMRQEMNGKSSLCNDVIRSYLLLLTGEAQKMKDKNKYTAHRNSAQRIAELFLALMERQFPITSPDSRLVLKSASDYANRMSIHVNHLNRVLKEVTGRTTSELIAGRMIRESVNMLSHTDYSVAQIGYSMGFEEPASFTNFLKKHTGKAPSDYKRMLIV